MTTVVERQSIQRERERRKVLLTEGVDLDEGGYPWLVCEGCGSDFKPSRMGQPVCEDTSDICTIRAYLKRGYGESLWGTGRDGVPLAHKPYAQADYQRDLRRILAQQQREVKPPDPDRPKPVPPPPKPKTQAELEILTARYGPLRAVVKVIDRTAGGCTQVLLECGHNKTTHGEHVKLARCRRCKGKE